MNHKLLSYFQLIYIFQMNQKIDNFCSNSENSSQSFKFRRKLPTKFDNHAYKLFIPPFLRGENLNVLAAENLH